MTASTRTLRHRATAWLLTSLACATALHAAVRKPNFLFIYTGETSRPAPNCGTPAIYHPRIPMLVRYPRLFGKGQVIDEMVLNIDLAPTFLDLAGVAAPAAMQGVSWKALAAGQKPANWRQAFLAEYFVEMGDARPWSASARPPRNS